MAKKPEGSYRSPPQHTRFRPGQSGNPKGRPQGSKNLKTVVDKELRKRITLTESGRPRQVTKLEVIVQRLVHDAIKGHLRAAELLLRLHREYAVPEGEPGATPEQIGLPDKATLRRVKERLDLLVSEEGE